MPQVKVVFEAEKEIRRFLLPSSGAFEDLRGKVRSVLGDNVNFRLYWKDTDGDFVVCESDTELQTALDLVATSGNQSDLLRLYVRVTSGVSGKPAAANSVFDQVTLEDDMDTDEETAPPSYSSEFKKPEEKKEKPEDKKQDDSAANKDAPAGPKEHVGLSCDGCGNRVIGTRFKCTKCPDYDLCETCKGRGYHLEHELEAITEPRPREEFINGPWMNMPFGGPRRGGPRFHGRHHGFGGHGHGHRHGHPGHMFNSQETAGSGTASAGAATDGFGPFPSMPGMPGGFAPFPRMRGFMGPRGPFNWQNATASGTGAASATSTSDGHGCSAGGFASAGHGPCGGQFPGFGGNPPKTVDEIAKQLEDMGIKADGGVIRDLIEQFQGDIRKIIEAMS